MLSLLSTLSLAGLGGWQVESGWWHFDPGGCPQYGVDLVLEVLGEVSPTKGIDPYALHVNSIVEWHQLYKPLQIT